jgi:hypothetical protein
LNVGTTFELKLKFSFFELSSTFSDVNLIYFDRSYVKALSCYFPLVIFIRNKVLFDKLLQIKKICWNIPFEISTFS